MSLLDLLTTGATRRSLACWLTALTMTVGTAVCGQAAEPPSEATPIAPASVYIVLVGDSTVTDNAGWGRAFADLLLPTVRCTNTARGGQSTKSFLDSGNWAKALALHPTHVLIQFGHNDQPGKGPNRETDPKTTYRANLTRYVDEARAAGARPILVTSLTRRTFINGKLVDSLAPYPEAMKAVAAEKHVPLVDLHDRSFEVVERLGPVASEELGPFTKEGKRDHSHLAEPGKIMTAQLVVAELCKVAPDLAPCFRPMP
ncbi:MAG TPA: rhamnogalacturonan acetylesterase [Pirellulales bacterium]|jgi:lysophospholipase L1-like esterase|nr:rhamnogalacturonan acetylesterase [Pirellulales bacterium]